MFGDVFVTFPCGILYQVWYLIVSIPDICHLSDFAAVKPRFRSHVFGKLFLTVCGYSCHVLVLFRSYLFSCLFCRFVTEAVISHYCLDFMFAFVG